MNTFKRSELYIAIGISLCCCHVEGQPSGRQAQWQENEVEALIHFGPNSFTGREWGLGTEPPVIFNPSEMNCDQWVTAAKSFGAKTIIFTAKHHDGFCLWPSSFTDYSVSASPWKDGQGDVVKEVAEACKRGGIGLGIYLSPGDRHHPAYGRNSQAYNEYFKNQLRELLTNYGKITQVFLDGAEPVNRQQNYDWPGFYAVIRDLQPDAVISIRGPDVRWVGNEHGEARESEWSVIPIPKKKIDFDWKDMRGKDLGSRGKHRGAAELVWYPAVADVSLRAGWFWNAGSEHTIKSLPELVRIYENSVGRNAGLQLNISPDKRGLIPDADVKRLQEFGAEIKRLFGTNLISESKSRVNKRDNVDGWITVATVDLDKASDVKYVVLQEDIKKGQMVEEFEVILTTFDNQRKTMPGTTIGYKRILKVCRDSLKMSPIELDKNVPI